MKKLPLYRKKPINRFSDKEKVRRRSRAQVYIIVARRARGICEATGCFNAQDPLAPHHAFGRGTKGAIDTDLCETPEAILGICDDCHRQAHDEGHEGLLGELGMKAVRDVLAMLSEHGVTFAQVFGAEAPDDYIECARVLTRWAQTAGYEWNTT